MLYQIRSQKYVYFFTAPPQLRTACSLKILSVNKFLSNLYACRSPPITARKNNIHTFSRYSKRIYLVINFNGKIYVGVGVPDDP